MSECKKCGNELPKIDGAEVEYCPICGKKNNKNEVATNRLPVLLGTIAIIGFFFNWLLYISGVEPKIKIISSIMSTSLGSTSLGWISLAISANNYYTKNFDIVNDSLGIFMGAVAIIANLVLFSIVTNNAASLLQSIQNIATT